MDPPWPMIGRALMTVPLSLRDAAYDCVAKHRYAMFGRTGACQVRLWGTPWGCTVNIGMGGSGT